MKSSHSPAPFPLGAQVVTVRPTGFLRAEPARRDGGLPNGLVVLSECRFKRPPSFDLGSSPVWTAVRGDRSFGGADPPAAFYVYSPDRGGVHPEAFLRARSGIMQADAHAGFNRLYEPGRLPGTIVEAGCWAHWRRKCYGIAALKKAPIAIEAVTRINSIFAIERTINGLTPSQRQAVRGQTETREFFNSLLAALALSQSEWQAYGWR